MLPKEPKERKDVPIASGVIDYFPDAIVDIARLSRIGNDQHNPGKPLHWDRSKSGDESDALMRHFVERGQIDADGVRHSTKVAWRALALLQKEVENEGSAASEHEQLAVNLESRWNALFGKQEDLFADRGGDTKAGDLQPCYRDWKSRADGLPS
jgi:hypothetical protein